MSWPNIHLPYLVRSKALDHLHLWSRTTGDDLGTVVLGKLDRNRPNRTASSVDHHALSGLQVSMLEKPLMCRHSDRGEAACLVEGHACGFADETRGL